MEQNILLYFLMDRFSHVYSHPPCTYVFEIVIDEGREELLKVSPDLPMNGVSTRKLGKDGSNETVIPSAVTSPPSQPATEERASRPPVTSNPTVDAAFKALRKLMAATEVGINIRDYGQLVIEAKAVAKDIAPNPSANKGASMQKELEDTIQAYQDALTAWDLSIKYHDGSHFCVD